MVHQKREWQTWDGYDPFYFTHRINCYNNLFIYFKIVHIQCSGTKHNFQINTLCIEHNLDERVYKFPIHAIFIMLKFVHHCIPSCNRQWAHKFLLSSRVTAHWQRHNLKLLIMSPLFLLLFYISRKFVAFFILFTSEIKYHNSN